VNPLIADSPTIVDVASRRGLIKPDSAPRISRMPVPGASRYALSVEVSNIDEVERDYLNTLIAILTDPAMSQHRCDLRHGRISLMIDGDEVTWIDPREGGQA
jgi:hypothetical protein